MGRVRLATALCAALSGTAIGAGPCAVFPGGELAGQQVAEPVNDHQRDDLRKWLPGLSPGDLAASPSNPVLWPTA